MTICTKDNVKDYLGIKNTSSTDSDLIDDLIDRVEVEIETYLSRSILSTETTEYFDGGVGVVFLKNTPVTTISGVWDNSIYTFDDDSLVSSDDYVILNNNIRLKGYSFTEGNKNIKVIYTGGYTTTPLDLLQVCIEEVGRKYKHRQDYDVISRTASDGSSTYVEKGFLKRSKMVLDKYKWRSLA